MYYNKVKLNVIAINILVKKNENFMPKKMKINISSIISLSIYTNLR